MKEKLQEEARAKYGLTPEQIREAEEQLEEIAAAMAANTNAAAGEAATASASVAATMGDPTTMDKEGKVAMLRALHARLASLQATLQQHSAAKAEAAQPSTSDQENLVANAPTGTHAAVPPTTVATAVAKQSKGSARGRGKGPSKVTAGSKRRAAIAAADGDDDDFMDGGDEEMVDASAAALSADVATLTAMGFGERQARDALEEADGNIDMAAEWLMTHCV